jgi:hypothetical protein
MAVLVLGPEEQRGNHRVGERARHDTTTAVLDRSVQQVDDGPTSCVDVVKLRDVRAANEFAHAG